MRVFYSDFYTVDLPAGHRFPMQKYRMVREALVSSGAVLASELSEPGFAQMEDLLRAHDRAYVEGFLEGRLPAAMMRRIGFPWSEGLVRRIMTTVGGAVEAADHALEHGLAGNLAGGTHHALRAAGEGFCVFNDLAVVALRLLAQKRVERLVVLDLDVHQGNGVSAILGGVPGVFVVSVHGERNYPFEKVGSTLDVGLPDGTGDRAFLRVVREIMRDVVEFDPQLVLYQAGVDGLASDRLGRLALSHEGLMARDELVLSELRSREIPVSLALGGGYAEPISDTVAAHVGTYRVLRNFLT